MAQLRSHNLQARGDQSSALIRVSERLNGRPQ